MRAALRPRRELGRSPTAATARRRGSYRSRQRQYRYIKQFEKFELHVEKLVKTLETLKANINLPVKAYAVSVQAPTPKPENLIVQKVVVYDPKDFIIDFNRYN